MAMYLDGKADVQGHVPSEVKPTTRRPCTWQVKGPAEVKDRLVVMYLETMLQVSRVKPASHRLWSALPKARRARRASSWIGRQRWLPDHVQAMVVGAVLATLVRASRGPPGRKPRSPVLMG